MTWEALLRTVDVSGFPLPLRFRIEADNLITSFKPTGKDWIDCRPLKIWPLCDHTECTCLNKAIRDIRREAQMAALHELDEVLLVDGRKINDPHANPPHPDYRT